MVKQPKVNSVIAANNWNARAGAGGFKFAIVRKMEN
jgi:hypothetical protein